MLSITCCSSFATAQRVFPFAFAVCKQSYETFRSVHAAAVCLASSIICSPTISGLRPKWSLTRKLQIRVFNGDSDPFLLLLPVARCTLPELLDERALCLSKLLPAMCAAIYAIPPPLLNPVPPAPCWRCPKLGVLWVLRALHFGTVIDDRQWLR